MKRRSFLSGAAAGAAAAIASAPAIVQANTTINWRLASSFPKSLDTIFGAAEILAKRVSQLTQGKFNIRAFPGGEIVPALQVLDAVQAGTVEIGHSASYYYFGKDPTFAFDTAIPFGLTSRQQTAWMEQGGGKQLLRDFFREYGVINLLGGNTGCQMGGWFRREVNTPKDLSGLKMRVGGFAGRILQKLGVVPQQIAPGDIYPALEKGTIDAAEWVGPYDDEKLGFNKVAKYYYTPGWWEGNAPTLFLVNAKAWDGLPKEYQNVFTAASAEANVVATAKYDYLNPIAMKKLLASGTQLRTFPREVMDACYKAAMEQYAEWSATNPDFKRLYDSYSKSLDEQISWFRVAEGTYDNYMSYVKQPKKK